MDIQTIKNRFGIIGNSPQLNHAISIAERVSSTNLTVLITGESGVGKEVFSQIIHQLSSRKHNNFIAVNCGAIPEGTIDSELFGHEKGSFTGANDARKGYFETVNGGTIFLDEVGELIGLLHDLGKYSKEFQDYINSALGNIDPDADDYVDAKGKKGKVDHSTAGAQAIWDELSKQGQSQSHS